MTLTTTAAVTYGDVPQVLVSVSSSPSVTGALKVWRTHEDGTRHRVLSNEGAVLIGTWAGYDYHTPFNQEVQYSAESVGQTSALSAEVYLPCVSTWLIHPSDPDLSVMVDMVAEVGDFSYADRSQKFQVLGRRLPVHRTYERGGETGSMRILCESDAMVSSVRALFASGGPVLVNTPQNANNLGWKWVQPGELRIENPGKRVRTAYRMASFSYEETTQPDADLVPQWTFDDVAATFATFDDVTAAYADFTAMALDVRS